MAPGVLLEARGGKERDTSMLVSKMVAYGNNENTGWLGADYWDYDSCLTFLLDVLDVDDTFLSLSRSRLMLFKGYMATN